MVLMLVAYDSSRTHLEAQARETARRVAQQHEQSVSRAIEVRHEHAQAFLRSVEGCAVKLPREAASPSRSDAFGAVSRSLPRASAPAERGSSARAAY